MVSSDFDKSKSLNGNIWRLTPADNRQAELIAQRFSLSPLVARILTSRNILENQVNDFLNPKLQNLMPNPFVLKDMEKAVKRIAQAIMLKQKIAIIGDYDVDGATSTSVMRLFLESVGIEPLVHIPERDEGYGPSIPAVDEFYAQGAELIITVDCGTTAFEVLEYAAHKNMDVIVIDHHEAEMKLPKIYAVVNPKRLDDDSNIEYLKYMAAVGVVFLTVVAINRELREQNFYTDKTEPNLMNFLDLVALGTVCDVVPLLGLNRAYVRQGLKVMSLRQNIGLKALFDKSGVAEAPSAYHLGFVLGPRINACGRVGEASIGNKLLCTKDAFLADNLAQKMNDFNDTRKEIEGYVLLKAIEILEGTPQEYPIAFAYGDDWHQGVIGIVAGKLKERYNLPSFVMSIESDEVKGSARSVAGVDVGALVMSAKEKGILTKGGGHTMAAGFSLNADRIEDFKKFAGEYVAARLGDEAIVPVIEADGIIDVSGATYNLVEELSRLEPYGAQNSEPKVIMHKVRVSKASLVGTGGHVRCFLSSASGGSLKAMAFKIADSEAGMALLNSHGRLFDVIGTLRPDNWMGRKGVQFFIEDVREACILGY